VTKVTRIEKTPPLQWIFFITPGGAAVNETKTRGVQGRADFYAKLLQICAIFLALIGGGLAAQMKAGEYDIFFVAGAVIFAILLAVIGYLLVQIHRNIQKLEESE